MLADPCSAPARERRTVSVWLPVGLGTWWPGTTATGHLSLSRCLHVELCEWAFYAKTSKDKYFFPLSGDVPSVTITKRQRSRSVLGGCRRYTRHPFSGGRTRVRLV